MRPTLWSTLSLLQNLPKQHSLRQPVAPEWLTALTLPDNPLSQSVVQRAWTDIAHQLRALWRYPDNRRRAAAWLHQLEAQQAQLRAYVQHGRPEAPPQRMNLER